MKTIIGTSDACKVMSKLITNKVLDNIYQDNSYLWNKPLKYYIRPIISFKIPWLSFDVENGEDGGGRTGLFFDWKTIEIGHRKELNKDYKEKMKEWKNKAGLIYFLDEDNFKINGLARRHAKLTKPK